MKETFQVISPVDGSVYVERQLASGKEIEEALAAAEQAQKSWKATSIAERASICQKAVEYFLENTGAIAEELSWQMGRPIRYTPFEISRGFQERARYMIDIAEDALADVRPEAQAGFRRFIRREPLGTVLVLAPWNYPYLTSVNVVIPAIMAGNTVLLKHAQQTPLCAERYAAAFEAAGLPEGVFQYLHLSHEQVAKVISDSRIAHVAFTGSVEGGRAIQQAASRRFIAAGLELGGKDPAYVRPDANLEYSIENLVDGAFFNSGQSCCGIERIYVHEQLFDSFVEGFVELTKKYVLGNPLLPETTLGPMVRTSAAQFAREQIREAVSKGAKTLIGPNLFSANREGTPYMAPQVLIDVDHSMQAMTEESFAPVVGIMPVRDDAEAIRLMNDSRYGLTASIWSDDVEAAIRIGEQIETGTCYLNRCDYLDPALAWTGVKDSGRGCTLSALGYEALTRPKSYHLALLNPPEGGK
ncbi:MAG: aldehyde dehydrogenase family protein [Phaeodactylibacter sp.]|nr:aldehyde dehydrogenase family protein [Phaeodactylibacter sp.]